MGKKVVSLAVIVTLVAAVAASLALVSPASAEAGCPNEAASNGASHANAKSAHNSEKHGCAYVDPNPGPTPTPTPGPTDEADVRVVGVSVRAPDEAVVDEEFVVRVSVSLRNVGPADSVLVDITFDFSSSPGCSASPAGPVIWEDTTLPEDVGVSVGKGWLVTCTQAGTAIFDADVTVAIDPVETVTDPDTSNNSGSGSDATQVG